MPVATRDALGEAARAWTQSPSWKEVGGDARGLRRVLAKRGRDAVIISNSRRFIFVTTTKTGGESIAPHSSRTSTGRPRAESRVPVARIGRRQGVGTDVRTVSLRRQLRASSRSSAR